MKVTFASDAWVDYLYFQEKDKKALKKINALIKDLQRNPNESGIGKAEKLGYELSGYFSRRIDLEHRMVYKITKDSIEIAQLRFHY